MIQVTQNAFYTTIGKLDVHPSIPGRYDDRYGYRCVWKRSNGGDVVGESDGGTHLCESRYFVTDEFYAANREAIEKAGGRVLADVA